MESNLCKLSKFEAPKPRKIFAEKISPLLINCPMMVQDLADFCAYLCVLLGSLVNEVFNEEFLPPLYQCDLTVNGLIHLLHLRNVGLVLKPNFIFVS